MSDLLSIAALSLGSLVALFILTKLMGYREMSELSMFDYINGITIGSIAAEMSTALEDDYRRPLTAMIVYALVSVLLSLLSRKSKKARRFIEGTPVILYHNNELYEKNMKRCKIHVDELLSLGRINGLFDLSQIQTALLESNGKISFLPKAANRPVNPNDLNLKPPEDSIVANIIIDGHIMEKNLHHTGKDHKWLQNQLHAQGYRDASEVLLATCDIHNTFHAYGRNTDKRKKDILS